MTLTATRTSLKRTKRAAQPPPVADENSLEHNWARAWTKLFPEGVNFPHFWPGILDLNSDFDISIYLSQLKIGPYLFEVHAILLTCQL